MFHSKIILFLTLLLIGFGFNSSAQTDTSMIATKFTEEQQRVMTTIEKMVDSFENKDIEGIMACYEKDATIVFEPESPVSDSKMAKEFFRGAFDINPKYTFNGHEVFINGDIAVHFTPWVMDGTLPDGTAISQSGLSVAVLRKQADGQWLMVFDNPHGQFLMAK